VQVEPRALIEYVQFDADQTDRIVLSDSGHGRELEPGRIDDCQRATPDHLQRFVGSDEGGGVLVQADPDRERVVGQRRQQTAEPVSLPKMLDRKSVV